MAQQYREAFFPNTSINGLDASGKTMDEVKSMIASEIEGYTLTIETGDGRTEQITGSEIGLRPEFDDSLDWILQTQNPYAWLDYQLNPASYSIDAMVVYDEEALDKRIASLSCMDPSQMRPAVDASISEYTPGQGYRIIPEEPGTEIDGAAFKEALEEAVRGLESRLSLSEAGVYREAAVRRDSPELSERLEALNRYAKMEINYQFGSRTETLGGDRIHEWLTTDEAGNLAVNEEMAAAYVAELAAEYNTSSKAKTIRTSSGAELTVKGGTYGWRINQAEETKQLIADILSGESQTREPVYGQRAASRDGNDYGNTYVEINLTAQHLYMYKDGKLLVESDFVSGNLARGWGTPAGAYPLTYKQRNAVLKGENYRTPVDYWMPFNGGIGMHDAKWRGAFGGSIYRTNGSHGCINLPHSVAKTIYENIQAGMPVICYNLSGTERAGSTPAPAVPAPPAETQPAAPEQPPVTETQPSAPAETPAQPAGPGSETPTPGETAPAETQPAPTEAPAPAPPEAGQTETPAEGGPAGPGSDPGNTGGGPGA
ncbi:MAG: L,D-transpeptidase family protein [Clostridium sp.]|nr:L,D-transpeptidase family protein [Clostridium sp.]